MKKIRNSDKLVNSIVGHEMGKWFMITSRVSGTSGHPTFSLYYLTFRSSKIPLVVDMPLRDIKENLKRFAKTNLLMIFPYVEELMGELVGHGNFGGGRRFYPPLLNSEEWQWCECGGLKKGRVVPSGDHYLLRPAEEGNRDHGTTTTLCHCGEIQVEIALIRYFMVEGIECSSDDGRPLIKSDDGHMVAGETYDYYGQTGVLRELGLFETYEKAEEAAALSKK